MELFTPQELWKNYNRELPVEAAVVKEIKTDGRTERSVYFGGAPCRQGRVRVFARLLLPEEKNPPVIIFLSEKKRNIETAYFDWVDKGYAVLALDYAGKRAGKLRHTIYPRCVDAYWERDEIVVPQNPFTSDRYYWTTCVLHAVTYLEQCDDVDSSRIGLIGDRCAAAVIWMAAYLTNLKAGITYFGNEYGGENEVYLQYKACLDSRAYAKNNFPILIQTDSNEKGGSLDFLSVQQIAAADSCLSVHPRTCGCIGVEQVKNAELWMNALLRNDWARPVSPMLNLIESDGSLYAEIIVSSETSVDIYYSSGEIPEYRNWRNAEVTRVAGKYLAKLDVYNPELTIYAFAVAAFKDGYTLSSPVIAKQPQKLGVVANESLRSRLVYQSENGKDSWFKEGVGEDNVGVGVGPYGLDGVCGDRLKTYKISEERYRAEPDSLMQIIMYSPQKQDAEIALITEDDEYVCVKPLALTDEWSTFTLSGKDFKSVKGSITPDKAIALEIRGKDIIINSLIWV